MAKKKKQNTSQGPNQAPPGQGQSPSTPQGQGPPNAPQSQAPTGQQTSSTFGNQAKQKVILSDADQMLISVAMDLRRQKIQYETSSMPNFTVQTSVGDIKYSEFLEHGPQGAYNALSNEAREELAKAVANLIKKLRFIDDELFRAVMDGQKALIQDILRRITGDPTLTLATMQLQKDYYFPGQYHSCTPDVYCETTDGRIIIIELQKQEKNENAARSSFLAHAASFASLESGHSYNEMKDVYVIFLTDVDTYGTGEFIHWIRDPETFPKFRGDPQPRHTPQTHKIFVNCKYGYNAIEGKKRLVVLQAQAAHETDEVKKSILVKQINNLKLFRNKVNKRIRVETSRYGLTTKDWRGALAWAHDLCSAKPDEIDHPGLAKLMQLVKEPNSEGVSAMSPIVYAEIQKVSAQVREETRKETREETRKETRREDKLEFAEKALAANIKPDTVRLITGLSDEEIQDLLARVTP